MLKNIPDFGEVRYIWYMIRRALARKAYDQAIQASLEQLNRETQGADALSDVERASLGRWNRRDAESLALCEREERDLEDCTIPKKEVLRAVGFSREDLTPEGECEVRALESRRCSRDRRDA